MNQDDEGRWHLDKRVPITMLLAILTQACVGVWWVAKLEGRIDRMESRQEEQRARDDTQDRLAAESKLQLLQRLDRIDDKLDRLIERRNQK